MKTFCRITALLALALLAASQVVRAQEPLLVNIPFAFTAEKIMLPAGEYRVQKLSADSVVLLIQRTDQSVAACVISQAAQADTKESQSKLVFHRYGDRYFLAEVWRAGELRGRQLPRSAMEKEQTLAREEAPDQVTIVARLTQPKP